MPELPGCCGLFALQIISLPVEEQRKPPWRSAVTIQPIRSLEILHTGRTARTEPWANPSDSLGARSAAWVNERSKGLTFMWFWFTCHAAATS
jgi:hypothetical protein